MKRRFLALMVILLALLAGCTTPTSTDPRAGESTIPASPRSTETDSSASSDDLTPLTIGLTYIPDIQFAPFYLADKRGYFTDEGLAVTLRHHGAGESLFGALAAGDEDVVNAGADEMLQARSQGIRVTTFAQMYQTYPAVLITPKASDISSLADLKGKRVGVPGPFGESWFALLAMTEEAGLTQDDLTIEFIGYTIQAALMTEKVDAVIGFSNSDVINFEAAGMEVKTFSIANNPLKSIALGAMETTVDKQPDVLKKLNSALSKAMRDIIEDPASAVSDSFDYLPKVTGANKITLAEQVLTATAKLYGDDPLALDPAAWPEMAEFLRSNGLLQGEVDATAAVRDVSDSAKKND